jgi:hypothetical protein
VASWRTVAGATVLAVSATAGLAVVVDAAPAPQSHTSSIRVTDPVQSAQQAVAAPLAPVTEHALDPATIPAPGVSGGQSVTQTVQLTIIGGPLELAADAASVTLERVPGSSRDWVGSLPPVRVVDARGTHEGWDVRWTVTSIEPLGASEASHLPDAKIRLQPDAPAVVAGTPDGLVTGKPGRAVQTGRTLFGAEAGSGGGTYEAGGTLSLRLPSDADVDGIVVHLAFSFG